MADFGFVSPLPIQSGSTSIVTAVGAIALAGTRGYLAPEFTEGKHGIKSDVYSYGVVSCLHIKRIHNSFHGHYFKGGFGNLYWASGLL